MSWLALGLVGAAGCSWLPKARPVLPDEKLQLESAVVTVPSGTGWTGSREFEVARRQFDLSDQGHHRSLRLLEVDGSLPMTDVRSRTLAGFTAFARASMGGEGVLVTELETTPDPRFGSGAVQVVLRAEQTRAQAGLLVPQVLYLARLAFASPDQPGRTIEISYEARGVADQLTPESILETFSAVRAGVELRPATPANVAAAVRANDFPKTLEPGLAHRSLTLPRGGFQAGYAWERWIAPGGWSDSASLSLGITDQIELEAPGFLRYSFGEVEALTRPEFAVGAGLTGYQHEAGQGNLWGAGLTLQARQRIASGVAWRVSLLGELAHQSATGRNRFGGGAVGGVVWDDLPLVSLALEAGYQSRVWKDHSTSLVWIGGRSTPLVTIHAPLLDIGLRCAVAWDHGHPGVLAGGALLLTF
jgi:hypothetical protein